jgi:hypothetical protein
MRDRVQVINKDAVKARKDAKHRYTHLWGTTKKDRGYMASVWLCLYQEDRKLFDRVDGFCRENNLYKPHLR